MRYAKLVLTMTGIALLLVARPAAGQNGMDETDVQYEGAGVANDVNYGPSQGDWEFILGGGGSSDNNVNVGDFRFDAELGHYLSENWAVALRQGLSYSDQNMGTTVSGSTRAAVDYHFDMGRWRPFVGVNLGYVYGDNVEDTFAGGPEAGVKWYAKDDTFIYGRAEYQFLFDEIDDADDNDLEDGRFIYTIGIGFNF